MRDHPKLRQFYVCIIFYKVFTKEKAYYLVPTYAAAGHMLIHQSCEVETYHRLLSRVSISHSFTGSLLQHPEIESILHILQILGAVNVDGYIGSGLLPVYRFH